MIWAGRIAGQGVYLGIFFNQSFIIEVFITGITPVFASYALMKWYKASAVDRLMLYHNGIVIIIVVFVLLCQLISTYAGCHRKAAI